MFGINKFFNYMPSPKIGEEAGLFFGALVLTGYYLPVLGFVEAGAGILLLMGRALPLALVMLSAVVPHIVLYLTILVGLPGAFVMAGILMTLTGFLIWRQLPALVHLLHTHKGEFQ